MKLGLSKLIEKGHGKSISEFSKYLGNGLCCFEFDDAVVFIFENGFRYEAKEVVEVNYNNIVGIKSSMTVEKISEAQSREIKTIIMRFECGFHTYDFLFPLVIYSSLLRYFCEQVKQLQHKEVETGFVSDTEVKNKE